MSAEDLFREYLSDFRDSFYLSIKVIPGAQKTSVVEKMDDAETWKFRLAAPPEKGKANKELQRYLRKEFGIQAEVISGKTSREKLLKCQK